MGSRDNGNNWVDWSIGIDEQASVTALCAFRPIWNVPDTYLAWTNQGLYYQGHAMREWEMIRDSVMVQHEIRDFLVTYTTRSSIAHIYTATDSGVFCLGGFLGGVAVEMSCGNTPIGVNALATTHVSEADSIFAATDDGLYLYTNQSTATVQDSKEFSVNPLSVAPNPFNPSVTITFDNPDKSARIMILDINGRIVKDRLKYASQSYIWDASGFPSGLYFIRVLTQGKEVSEKIFLQK